MKINCIIYMKIKINIYTLCRATLENFLSFFFLYLLT
jgi:hypothetical protein